MSSVGQGDKRSSAVLHSLALATTSERIVREQARSIYSKAGLTGRAALSAFFLEDLLAPIEGLGAGSETP